MTVNTSASGGYLAPAPGPLEGDALEDFLQRIFAGIVGLTGKFVRPRWQPEPANIPPMSVDWMAFGITRREADTFAYVFHDADGVDNVYRNEVLTVLCTFYGKGADANAAILRDGLSVSQNLELLAAQEMGLVAVGDMAVVPEIVGQQWLRRVDLPVRLRRAVTRTYPVFSIDSANGVIEASDAPRLAPSTLTLNGAPVVYQGVPVQVTDHTAEPYPVPFAAEP